MGRIAGASTKCWWSGREEEDREGRGGRRRRRRRRRMSHNLLKYVIYTWSRMQPPEHNCVPYTRGAACSRAHKKPAKAG